MTLRIIGAGIGRTGTHSLQLALQQLLGGPCYHMLEVFGRPDDIRVWHAAAEGTLPDWSSFLAGYEAAVDWPASAFWQELAEAFPDAPVLLSTRSSADAWWRSADATIWAATRRPPGGDPIFDSQNAMVRALLDHRFTPDWDDESASKAAYDRHNAEVRATVPAARLIDWQPGDGWKPICDALGMAVPDEPFPHVNSTDEFRTMLGLS